MPSKAMGALKSYGLPTAMTATSDDPVDWATLFAGLRSSVPLTMLLGAREANAGEAEAVKRLPRYEQPRQYMAGDLDRELEHQYPSYVGGATAAYHRMLQKEMVEQMLREAREREASTRRADHEQPRPAPTQFIERRAAGGAILSDHTAPDMSDGGQLLADPNLYAGGGSVKRAKQLLQAPLYHGGTYPRGATITRPLYMSPSRELAESYVDMKSMPGSRLMELKPQVANPAPERLVRAATRKHVPENERFGYTPASAFDTNLHDQEKVEALIRELQSRGYDSAIGTDIGMTGPGAVEGDALIVFPGSRAYAGGGGVKKTLDEMEAELIKKGARATRAPEISRRAFFGLPQSKSYPIANVPKQELERLRDAPTFEERTTRVQPSPTAPKIEETVKKVAETPVSRRTVLKSASGQMLRGMLPEMGMQDIAKSVVQSADLALPQTAQGLMALALKQGMGMDEAVNFVRTMATRGGKQEPYDLPSMAHHMTTPHAIEVEGDYLPPSEVLRQMLRYDAEGSLQKLRAPMREIRQIDPARYQEMMQTARDVSKYGLED